MKLMACLLMLGIVFSAGPLFSMSYMGHVDAGPGVSFKGMIAAGDYFYLATNGCVKISDLKKLDPEEWNAELPDCVVDSLPELTNGYFVWSDPAMAVYYVSTDKRFSFYDISSPLNPLLLGSFVFEGDINAFAADANHFYVYQVFTYPSGGLISVNFSNPASVVFCDTLPLSIISAISIGNRCAYMTGVDKEVKIASLADPDHPVLLTSIQTASQPNSPYVDGQKNRLFFKVGLSASMKVYDVSHPDAPVAMGNLSTVSGARLVEIKDDVLFFSDNNSFIAYDFSDGQSLKLLCRYNVSGGAAILDSIVYLLNTRRLEVFNLNGPSCPPSAPDNPLDYLVIYPQAWSDAVSPYVAAKNRQGIRTEMASIEGLPGYSGSLSDTAVIKKFIYHSWIGRGLKYVLLVGDVDKIPSRIEPSPTRILNGFSDYNYNPFCTDFPYFNPYPGCPIPNQNKPDTREIMGARLPVDLKAQATRYLKLWMDYPGRINTPFGVTFVADSAWDIKSRTYSRTWLQDSWNTVSDAVVDSFFPSLPLTRQDIYDVFDKGPLFLNYLGHGNDWRWTAPDFTIDDALDINSHGKPCFMVTQSCRTADLDKTDCLIERFFEADSSMFLGIIAPTNSPMNYDWNKSYGTYEPYFWKLCADQYRASGRVFPCSLFCNLGYDFLNWGYFGDPTIVLDTNSSDLTKETSGNEDSPAFALDCAPNPFNPNTKMSFTLAENYRIDLDIYDLSGKRVRDIVSGNFKQGGHAVYFNGKDGQGRALASGVYMVRLTTPGRVLNYRAVLLR